MAFTTKIVGVDPSLRNLGIAHAAYDIDTERLSVSHVALITTEKGKDKTVRKSSDDFDRARTIIEAVGRETEFMNFAAAEMPIGSQSSAAMKSYGVSIAAIASIKCPVIQISPTEVKVAAVGSKTATKRQMIDWAYGLYPDAKGWLTKKRGGVVSLTDANEHMADAIGAIHAAIQTDQFRQAIEAARQIIRSS